MVNNVEGRVIKWEACQEIAFEYTLVPWCNIGIDPIAVELSATA